MHLTSELYSISICVVAFNACEEYFSIKFFFYESELVLLCTVVIANYSCI